MTTTYRTDIEYDTAEGRKNGINADLLEQIDQVARIIGDFESSRVRERSVADMEEEEYDAAMASEDHFQRLLDRLNDAMDDLAAQYQDHRFINGSWVYSPGN